MLLVTYGEMFGMNLFHGPRQISPEICQNLDGPESRRRKVHSFEVIRFIFAIKTILFQTTFALFKIHIVLLVCMS